MREPEQEAARWLKSAREDLAYARHAAASGFYAPACCHAEKAVKALHYRRGARAVIGHNVRSLIQSLDPSEPELERHLDAARQLDLFYITSRYPNGLDSGTPGEAFDDNQATGALGAAERIISAVEATG